MNNHHKCGYIAYAVTTWKPGGGKNLAGSSALTRVHTMSYMRSDVK
jgi:hypothetical protein